jgi:4-amino-4-deoxy-L-arabinose transferase-like glycosyltransferase
MRSEVRFAAAVLLLAALNLTVRLDREMVQPWDEALYAANALDMYTHGFSAATTSGGQLDYYHTKPPLNAWLIASAFRVWGVDLLPLRLPSVISAWLTVLVVLLWSRQVFGSRVSLLAGLVLSTTYGFLYVHSGRTADAEAPLTLLVTLAAMAAWHSRTNPWSAAWLGPLTAGVVLLKGPAALGFIAPIVAVGLWRLDRSARWRPMMVAVASAATIVGAWAALRWQVDGAAFLALLFTKDVLARAVSPLEGHSGSPLFYVQVLFRHQYDWLVAVALAVAVGRPSWRGGRERWQRATPAERHAAAIVAGWFVATVVVPTVIVTKTAWYLNPFYPLFAVIVAVVLDASLAAVPNQRPLARRLLAVVIVATVAGAEARLAWRSVVKLDLSRSAQELLLRHADRFGHRTVFAPHCPAPETMLARAANAECVVADGLSAAFASASAGDFWLGPVEEPLPPGARRIDSNAAATLVRLAP